MPGLLHLTVNIDAKDEAGLVEGLWLILRSVRKGEREIVYSNHLYHATYSIRVEEDECAENEADAGS